MVSSITPNGVGASVVGLDARLGRTGAGAAGVQEQTARSGDSVAISAASIAAVRESVRAGLEQAHRALAVGHDAQTALLSAQAIVRAGGPQQDLSALLAALSNRVEDAIAQGAVLLQGESVNVQAEPGAAPLTIDGADLRLGQDVIGVDADAQIGDAALPQALQRSLETLQAAMSELLETAQALEAHQGFLGAAANAVSGVKHDLDADSARLLALQVRQGLEAMGAAPIANAEPQSVLALFRA